MPAPLGTTTIGRLQYAFGGGALLEAHLEKFRDILDFMTAKPSTMVNTAITTIGAGTLTAAALAGAAITRSGSIAAYTDTTDTAAALWAAVDNPQAGQSWVVSIKNTVAFAETLAAGTGVTLSGQTVVPGLATGRFLVTLTSATAATVLGLGVSETSGLPVSQIVTNSSANPTLAAGDATGAEFCILKLTANGASAATTRTATEMFGDTPNAQVGQTYRLRICAGGNNTVTVTAGSGVTLTGTMTIATATWREFQVSFTSATALVIEAVGQGTFS